MDRVRKNFVILAFFDKHQYTFFDKKLTETVKISVSVAAEYMYAFISDQNFAFDHFRFDGKKSFSRNHEYTVICIEIHSLNG